MSDCLCFQKYWKIGGDSLYSTLWKAGNFSHKTCISEFFNVLISGWGLSKQWTPQGTWQIVECGCFKPLELFVWVQGSTPCSAYPRWLSLAWGLSESLFCWSLSRFIHHSLNDGQWKSLHGTRDGLWRWMLWFFVLFYWSVFIKFWCSILIWFLSSLFL